jgi:hypothetical protein
MPEEKDNLQTSVLPEAVRNDLLFLEQSYALRSPPVDIRQRRIAAFRAIAAYTLEAPKPQLTALIDAMAKQSDMLHSFAWTAAIQSVRKCDEMWIGLGLIAMALENMRLDWRETLIKLSLIGNSARKIEAPLDQYVRQAVMIAPPECAALIQGFYQQPLENQSIELMGYREATDEDRFTYIQVDDE